MPRFVILEHDHPMRHWDLMLEASGALRTWRLDAPPEAGCVVAADALSDHRLFYLDYEGPVSGNRGSVVRWDWGQFVIDRELEDEIVLRLQGSRLHGTGCLHRTPDGRWQFEMS